MLRGAKDEYISVLNLAWIKIWLNALHYLPNVKI